MADGINSELKNQAKAAFVMVGLAIMAVLGIVVLEQFRIVIHGIAGLGAGNVTGTTNNTAGLVITAFVAGLALFGSFATLTALIIVVKAIIGVVKNLN